jgi:hypothetical protein
VVYNANKQENFEGEGGYCSKTGICESMLMFSGKWEFNYEKLFSGESSFSSCNIYVNIFACVQSPTHNA